MLSVMGEVDDLPGLIGPLIIGEQRSPRFFLPSRL